MDNSTRRRFLGLSGLAGTIGLTGCLNTITGGSGTPTPANKDSDGDGVIDSEDYAPRDASVQRAEQVQERDSTPTETASTEPPTETTPSSSQLWDFESGTLDNWEQVVVPDNRNEDVVDWEVIEDSIEGSYSAYCNTVGDNNHLRTEETVIEMPVPFEISYTWRTSDSDSRGIDVALVNGETGSNFERRVRFRVGLDVDGNPRVQAAGEEMFFSDFDYNQSHTTTVRYENGEFSVHLNARELFTVVVEISGEYHIGFNTSGHFGSSSNMKLDNVRLDIIEK